MRSEPPLLEHQATLCNPAFMSKEPDGNWTVSDHRLSQHRLVRAMMRGVPRIVRRTPVDDVHPGLALPVVYVYFGRARLRENEYLCCTLRASLLPTGRGMVIFFFLETRLVQLNCPHSLATAAWISGSAL